MLLCFSVCTITLCVFPPPTFQNYLLVLHSNYCHCAIYFIDITVTNNISRPCSV